MSSRKPVTTHVTLEGCNVTLDNSYGALDVRQFVLKNVHMSFQFSPEPTANLNWAVPQWAVGTFLHGGQDAGSFTFPFGQWATMIETVAERSRKVECGLLKALAWNNKKEVKEEKNLGVGTT
ncbi:hypothetical protein E4U56_006378 [Claviceps arundinis]|uniref:Uncharacterized protein n=1 Tax=Claviceps arundinis TaxID=1623583 RepID=A0A9P7MW67_9HYPO|nr:hypothetical protein E4U56_006378 [Claviceps arundinis]